MDYICKKKCYFRGKVWLVGQAMSVPEAVKVPAHFVEKSEYKAPASKKEKPEPKTMLDLAKAGVEDFLS